MLTETLNAVSIAAALLYVAGLINGKKEQRPEQPVLVAGQPLLLLCLGLLFPHLKVFQLVISYAEPLAVIGMATVAAEAQAVLQLRLGLLPSTRISFAIYVHERIDDMGGRATDVHIIALALDLLTARIFPLFARTRTEHELLGDYCRLRDLIQNRANPSDFWHINLEHKLCKKLSAPSRAWFEKVDREIADWLRAGLHQSRDDVLQALCAAGAKVLFVSHTTITIQPPIENEKPIRLRGGKYSAEFRCKPAVASAGQFIGLSDPDRMRERESLLRAIFAKFGGRTKASERFARRGDGALLGKGDDVLASLLGQDGCPVERETYRMGNQVIGGSFGETDLGTYFAQKLRTALALVLPDSGNSGWDHVFGSALVAPREAERRASDGFTARTSPGQRSDTTETKAISLFGRQYLGGGYTAARPGDTGTAGAITATPTHAVKLEANPWPVFLHRYKNEYIQRKLERRRRLLAIAGSLEKTGDRLDRAGTYVLGAIHCLQSRDTGPERGISAPGSRHQSPHSGNDHAQGAEQAFEDLVSSIGFRIGKFATCRQRITAAIKALIARQRPPAVSSPALEVRPIAQRKPPPPSANMEVDV